MEIIETSTFTKLVYTYLTDDEYLGLQSYLLKYPESGKVVPGTGGVRKLRWAAAGKGKRGGSRVIYYWAVTQGQLLMLLIYSKSEREDLTREQLKTLKKIVEEEYP